MPKIITLSNLSEFKSKCDETYATMEDSGVINLGQLSSDGATANFHAIITEQEFNNIPQTGIAIVMFNTTCAMLPYVKGQDNRFVCNAVYDTEGNSMITRGKLQLFQGSHNIVVIFGREFANAIVGEIRPYGIIRFIGL